LGPAECAGADGSAIGFDSECDSDGEQQHEECVEVESCAEVAAEKGCERAGGAAAGTIEAEELVDGAGGIDCGWRGWVEQEGGAKDDRACERGVCEDASAIEGIVQIAAPR
jgi:hypothetical protein